MIGIGATLSAGLAALLAAVILTGSVGPGRGVVADRLVAERAAAAEVALAALDAALQPALEAARRGAARIVAGDESPSDELLAAADTTLEADRAATEVRRAVRRLAEAQRARDPDSSAFEAPIESGRLASIAGQLRATADAGEEFVELRHRADAVTAALSVALAALDEGDLDTAADATAVARDHHDAVRDWDLAPATLPVWLETTGAMIGAMETIVAATRSGDDEAARQAAEEIAALTGEAETSDRALRIAVAEGGSAVAATALGRLAEAVADVRDARARVAGIVHSERER